MRPPSPFRLILYTALPTPQRLKTVECPRSIQAVPGAKRYAKEWAANVGVAGVIELEQHVTSSDWKRIDVAEVRSSKITRWGAD